MTVQKAKTGAAGEAAANGAAVYTKAYEDALGVAREQMERAFPAAAKQFDELARFNKANLDALVAAGASAMKGFETLSQEMLAYNRKAMETGVSNAKALLAAKTADEVLEANAAIARTSLDQLASDGVRLSELAVKIANEAFEPVTSRLAAAATTLEKRTAA